MSIFFYSYPLC